MPIFELQCQACADIIEVLQKVKYTEEELAEMQCEACTEVGVMDYIMSSGGFTIEWWT